MVDVGEMAKKIIKAIKQIYKMKRRSVKNI